jgi:TonB family protein
MRIIILCSITICMFVLVFTINTNGQTVKGTIRKISATEISLRKRATKKVTPKYPKEALKVKASGVAVVEITISEKGDVSDVKILETPHKSIDISMNAALKQWKFVPFTFKGKAEKVSGKITYYFVIENQQNKVESPYPF